MSVARLAQLVERKALNLVVVGSSPTVGEYFARSKTLHTSRMHRTLVSRSSYGSVGQRVSLIS